MPEDIELNSLRRLIKHQLSNPKSLNAIKLINSGINNANNITREQFIDDCSFTTKSEIVLDHKNNPPFGSNLTRDLKSYCRLSKTSGTSGESISWLDTSDDWSNMLDAWDVIYNSSGLNTEQDIIYFAFSFGPFLGLSLIHI